MSKKNSWATKSNIFSTNQPLKVILDWKQCDNRKYENDLKRMSILILNRFSRSIVEQLLVQTQPIRNLEHRKPIIERNPIKVPTKSISVGTEPHPKSIACSTFQNMRVRRRDVKCHADNLAANDLERTVWLARSLALLSGPWMPRWEVGGGCCKQTHFVMQFLLQPRAVRQQSLWEQEHVCPILRANRNISEQVFRGGSGTVSTDVENNQG